LQGTKTIWRNGWFARANPISQADNFEIAEFRSGAKWRYSSKRTSLIVWTTLGLPTTQNDLLYWEHFLTAWTIAPNPHESIKSILLKSITTDSWLEARTSLIKVVNCFSE